MLSENDVKVLKAISEGESDPQSIAEKLRMKVEAVRASADALGEQGLISVDKSVEESVSLTDEGRKYAEEGLPERTLLSFIGSGRAMSDLKDPVHKIGLGWLRKKGWAAIQAGELKPLGSALRGLDEEILEKLLAGQKSSADLDKKGLADLKSRGLITSSKNKSWSYKTTKTTQITQTIELGSNADIVNEVGPITSDMIKSGHWEKDDAPYLTYNGEKFHIRRYDVTLAADRIFPGKKHPYQRLIDFMREIMLEMGFVEIKGQIVQSSFWNFDALFQPQDHPAREMQDTFYLDSRAEIPDYSRVKELHECGRGQRAPGGVESGGRRWPARRSFAPTPRE